MQDKYTGIKRLKILNLFLKEKKILPFSNVLKISFPLQKKAPDW